MVKDKRVYLLAIVLLLLTCLTAGVEKPVTAQEEELPVRQTTITVGGTEHEWWLIRWTDNLTACQLFIDHEGLPSGIEILDQCGEKVYNLWVSTPPCPEASKGESTVLCPGVYLYQAGFRDREQEVVVELPPATVTLTIEGCALTPPENFCPAIPDLVLTGEEPLPDEEILAIHVIYESNAITCEGARCQIQLRSTPLTGTPIEFWADSSFGDSSPHFTALLRVVESGVSQSPAGSGWYVDVLSTQWGGGPADTCADYWQVFPPVGGPPLWLSTPSQEVFLASDEPYQYLAGRLISQGLVDASECPGNGLMSNGYADACGLSKARSLVDPWQNQFDVRILNVAQETGLPAQLLKNLFAIESQFWPGIFRVVQEYGLGQITDLGADTILLWNDPFYKEFCPEVLSERVCSKGYLRLEDNERALLRGALAVQANADCPECPSGVDLSYADDTVMLFAQGLLANCSQVGQTITNATLATPGMVSSYEDLWRFTLANYNGGPGCLAFAIHTTWNLREPMDWEHVSTHFTPACQGAIAYVELITK
jgi:hypothetical protein